MIHNDELTYDELYQLYCFVDKFGCEPIRPMVARALCTCLPGLNLESTLQLATRLDDFPLVCSAIRLMNFEVFGHTRLWTIVDALKPTWHTAFIRCILDGTTLFIPEIISTNSISPLGLCLRLINDQADKRMEEFKRLVNMYAERARQM